VGHPHGVLVPRPVVCPGDVEIPILEPYLLVQRRIAPEGLHGLLHQRPEIHSGLGLAFFAHQLIPMSMQLTPSEASTSLETRRILQPLHCLPLLCIRIIGIPCFHDVIHVVKEVGPRFEVMKLPEPYGSVEVLQLICLFVRKASHRDG
jgi:hypothetical protein